MAIYSSLGVRRVINASGIYSDLGGSRLAPEVWAAAGEANAVWASMDELLVGLGSARRLAGGKPGGAGRAGGFGGDRAGRGGVRRRR